jgi:hypothetical protein
MKKLPVTRLVFVAINSKHPSGLFPSSNIKKNPHFNRDKSSWSAMVSPNNLCNLQIMTNYKIHH